jgi:hypothetical protein
MEVVLKLKFPNNSNTPQALRELFNALTGSAYGEKTPVRDQHP